MMRVVNYGLQSYVKPQCKIHKIKYDKTIRKVYLLRYEKVFFLLLK